MGLSELLFYEGISLLKSEIGYFKENFALFLLFVGTLTLEFGMVIRKDI